MLLLSRFIISGHSMEPTLQHGRSVLVSSIPYFFVYPKVGDVVAATINGKIFIKRISKREGKKYFLSGDNVHDSLDSRTFGAVSKEHIVGKVIFPFILPT